MLRNYIRLLQYCFVASFVGIVLPTLALGLEEKAEVLTIDILSSDVENTDFSDAMYDELPHSGTCLEMLYDEGFHPYVHDIQCGAEGVIIRYRYQDTNGDWLWIGYGSILKEHFNSMSIEEDASGFIISLEADMTERLTAWYQCYGATYRGRGDHDATINRVIEMNSWFRPYQNMVYDTGGSDSGILHSDSSGILTVLTTGPTNNYTGVTQYSVIVNGQISSSTIYPPGKYIIKQRVSISTTDPTEYTSQYGYYSGSIDSSSRISYRFEKVDPPGCAQGGLCDEDADVNGDGLVTIDDLVLWFEAPVDVTQDGLTNTLDAVVFTEALGIDSLDCDENGELDELELYSKECADLNSNGILDSCEFPEWEIGESPCLSGVSQGVPQVGEAIVMEAFPNPFNPRTEIRFEMSEAVVGRLAIYDTSGREIAVLIDSSYLGVGKHSIAWDGRIRNGSMAPSGVYYYRLVSRAGVGQGKLAMLK